MVCLHTAVRAYAKSCFSHLNGKMMRRQMMLKLPAEKMY